MKKRVKSTLESKDVLTSFLILNSQEYPRYIFHENSYKKRFFHTYYEDKQYNYILYYIYILIKQLNPEYCDFFCKHIY